MRARRRSGGFNQKQRRARRVKRVAYACLVSVIAALMIGVFALAPKEADKPVVTVYTSAACEECERWMGYLNSHGFRAVPGPADRRDHLRRELRLPSGFHSPELATVNGLFISGFVPVREIHQLLRGELGQKVIGVAVRHGSVPPWKSVAMASQGLTVFAVLPGGMLRPVKVYHGAVAVGVKGNPATCSFCTGEMQDQEAARASAETQSKANRTGVRLQGSQRLLGDEV